MPIAKHGQRPAWIVERLREGTMTEAEAEDTMRLRGEAFGSEYGPAPPEKLPRNIGVVRFGDGTLGLYRKNDKPRAIIVQFIPSHSRRGPRGQFVPVRGHRRHGWGDVEVLAKMRGSDPWTTVYEGGFTHGVGVAINKKLAGEYVRVLEKA